MGQRISQRFSNGQDRVVLDLNLLTTGKIEWDRPDASFDHREGFDRGRQQWRLPATPRSNVTAWSFPVLINEQVVRVCCHRRAQ